MSRKSKITLAIVVMFFVVLSILIVGFFGENDGFDFKSETSEPDSNVVETCNLVTYKESAQPRMQEFSNIVSDLEIGDANSRAETKRSLELLLSKINQVKCRDDFPLKHETLEYSVRHMIDAIEYANKGDFAEANFSINKSLLNVETFQDWSVDVN